MRIDREKNIVFIVYMHAFTKIARREIFLIAFLYACTAHKVGHHINFVVNF